MAMEAESGTADGSLESDAKYRGVSVYHLKEVFLPSLEATEGLSTDSRFYEIEDSRKETGFVREKGRRVTCPRDGMLGASYVDSLQGRDHVGKSTHMLSWTWWYKVGDVVETLINFCEQRELNMKRTYIWICALCLNQHRIMGTACADAFNFEENFRSHVLHIGHVIVMMTPWDEPQYLKRIWCIFELYTAMKNDVQISIVMPKQEEDRMTHELVGVQGKGINELYAVLQKTMIQNAKATVEQDRLKILQMVECNDGFHFVNKQVTQHIRFWIRGILSSLASAVVATHHTETASSQQFVGLCSRYGQLFASIGEYDLALTALEKAHRVAGDAFGEKHWQTIDIHDSIGSIYLNKGQYKKARTIFQKCLLSRECQSSNRNSREHRLKIANAHNSMGWAELCLGDYVEATKLYRKSLSIQEEALGSRHAEVAETYSNLGMALHRHGDYRGASLAHDKAIDILESCYGRDHPRTAKAYHSLGSVFLCTEQFEDALAVFQKCLSIREIALGEHPETAATLASMGWVRACQGKHNRAIGMYKQCLGIQKTTLGADHPDTAGTCVSIANSLLEKKRYDEAIRIYHKACTIFAKALGAEHPKTTSAKRLRFVSIYRQQRTKFITKTLHTVAYLAMTVMFSLVILGNNAIPLPLKIFATVAYATFVGSLVKELYVICRIHYELNLECPGVASLSAEMTSLTRPTASSPAYSPVETIELV
ncbi:Kinesin light chain [Seminavis robusta]|uniref:Kinesin light chain n=1 Tax=Seminavis robusta TaxID=568900 RepID=A0A9N8DMG4_9STRA|nr:Kinesin light chain [Seminavis robusta]|eukprot:Sro225_g091740.1 Kinesin light chain (711) ;mRNA; r:24813-27021